MLAFKIFVVQDLAYKFVFIVSTIITNVVTFLSKLLFVK